MAYGPVNTWFKTDADDIARSIRFKNRISEFLKVTKDCGNSTGCWSTAPLLYTNGTVYIYGYEGDLIQFDHFFLTVADGTSLAFNCWSGICSIKVDIDGPNKGKTQIGSDIFDFTISLNGAYNGSEYINLLIPSALPHMLTGTFDLKTMYNYTTTWVIRNENLDYFKCNDLNWETKTSCK